MIMHIDDQWQAIQQDVATLRHQITDLTTRLTAAQQITGSSERRERAVAALLAKMIVLLCSLDSFTRGDVSLPKFRAGKGKRMKYIGRFFVVWIVIVLFIFIPLSYLFSDTYPSLLAIPMSGIVFAIIACVTKVLSYLEQTGSRAALLSLEESEQAMGYGPRPSTVLRASAMVGGLAGIGGIAAFFLPWGVSRQAGALPATVSGFYLLTHSNLLALPFQVLIPLLTLLLDTMLTQVFVTPFLLRSPLTVSSAWPRIALFTAGCGVFLTIWIRLIMGYSMGWSVQPALWLPALACALALLAHSVARATIWIEQEPFVSSPVGGVSRAIPISHTSVRWGAALSGLTSIVLLGAFFLPIGVILGQHAFVGQFSGFDLLSGNLTGGNFAVGFILMLLVIFTIANTCMSIIAFITSATPRSDARIPYGVAIQASILPSIQTILCFISTIAILFTSFSSFTSSSYPLIFNPLAFFVVFVLPYLCSFGWIIGGRMISSGSGAGRQPGAMAVMVQPRAGWNSADASGQPGAAVPESAARMATTQYWRGSIMVRSLGCAGIGLYLLLSNSAIFLQPTTPILDLSSATPKDIVAVQVLIASAWAIYLGFQGNRIAVDSPLKFWESKRFALLGIYVGCALVLVTVVLYFVA